MFVTGIPALGTPTIIPRCFKGAESKPTQSQLKSVTTQVKESLDKDPYSKLSSKIAVVSTLK